MTYEQPFLFPLAPWVVVRDGNPTGRAIYNRHYSRYVYVDGRDPVQFVGPGEKLVLLTPCARGLFAWRKFIDHADDGTGIQQSGVNCAVFRNEGVQGVRSSDLVRAADAIADAETRWRGERHYTYVNPGKVRSTNPGYCFIQAGWRRCGRTKGGLVILERLP